MSSSSGNNPQGVQQPLFAPSTQQNNQSQLLGDDIDLNEIFADYFINEFEDPLNAYTSSMANYSGAAAAVALAQKQQQVEANAQGPAPAALPTGGIKTSFHTTAAVVEPEAKKAKVATTAPVAKSGLSDRLGFGAPQQQQQQQQPQQQQQQQAKPTVGVPIPPQPQVVPSKPPPAPAAAAAPAPGSLPVGVGIRLGGVGGVAPSTAAMASTARPVHPGAFMMWGGLTGATAGGTGMSEQAIAERRQRNREHAKRSRVRKKFMLESLQEQVKQLQKENVELRMIIQQRIPQKAQQIITECCSTNTLFSDPTDTAGNGETKEETSLVKSDFSLMESLTSGQQNFVLSDPRLPDNPIVYASPGFYQLTGYTQDQVLGRNCRFLQGPATDPRAVDIIRKAIASGSDSTTCLLNYKADGTPFWNQFFIAALRDSDNCIVNYVGVQCEVDAEAGASFLEDKVNQILPLAEKEGGEEGDGK